MLTDVILILAILTFAGLGFIRGFVKSAASVIRGSIAVIAAFLLSRPIASVLNSLFGLNKVVANMFDVSQGGPILVAIVTFIVFIAIRLVLHKLVKFAEKSREQSRIFNHVDRLLGALFGAVRFLFLFSLFAVAFYLITRISFIKPLHDTIFGDSTVAVWLYDLVVKLVLVQGIAAIAPK